MDACPRQPGYDSAQPQFAGLENREARSDNGHIPFVEVPERFLGGFAEQASSESIRRRCASSSLIPNAIAMSFLQQQTADDERYAGDNHRIIEAGVDVARSRDAP
jgi:hypothetical protein